MMFSLPGSGTRFFPTSQTLPSMSGRRHPVSPRPGPESALTAPSAWSGSVPGQTRPPGTDGNTRRPYGNVVGGGQNATVGLDDLLPHRRAALLWRFAPELDYAAVDALVRDSAATPCEQRWVLAGEV